MEMARIQEEEKRFRFQLPSVSLSSLLVLFGVFVRLIDRQTGFGVKDLSPSECFWHFFN